VGLSAVRRVGLVGGDGLAPGGLRDAGEQGAQLSRVLGVEVGEQTRLGGGEARLRALST